MGLLAKLMKLLRPAPVPALEPQELAARLRARPAPFVVDVRGPDEFSGPLGHIKGAVNMPLQTLLAKPPASFGKGGGTVVLVCRTDMRSKMAARHLLKAGRTDVAVLRGGMTRWQELQLPTA
jgi:rhodanese-related sulfurtransferase